MHGLVNQAVHCFVRDTYGPECWVDAMKLADLEADRFEALLVYDDLATERILTAVIGVLGKAREDTLEDIGTYLVSHPNRESLRRLLRFSGDCFSDFLLALDELPDRARLAVDDLRLPGLELSDLGGGRYILEIEARSISFGRVLMGVLRTMADDYGALAILDYLDEVDGKERISIKLIESAFSKGRSFDLGARRP